MHAPQGSDRGAGTGHLEGPLQAQHAVAGRLGPTRVDALIATLADHAQGNPRALMNIAGELLAVAAQREARHIDEKLFLEMCATPPLPEPKTARPRR